ncbi:hypothetical protein PQI66_00410 [Corynebacterium sp. USCH3]|uniref:hypothetical protein n=1 Tax=Corynebacterium sp. USCH3 TaxID=3024840 RepID=UPI0030A1B981
MKRTLAAVAALTTLMTMAACGSDGEAAEGGAIEESFEMDTYGYYVHLDGCTADDIYVKLNWEQYHDGETLTREYVGNDGPPRDWALYEVSERRSTGMDTSGSFNNFDTPQRNTLQLAPLTDQHCQAELVGLEDGEEVESPWSGTIDRPTTLNVTLVPTN